MNHGYARYTTVKPRLNNKQAEYDPLCILNKTYKSSEYLQMVA